MVKWDAICAMLCITMMCMFNMFMGGDGYTLAAGVGTIAAIIGVKVGNIYGEKKSS